MIKKEIKEEEIFKKEHPSIYQYFLIELGILNKKIEELQFSSFVIAKEDMFNVGALTYVEKQDKNMHYDIKFVLDTNDEIIGFASGIAED